MLDTACARVAINLSSPPKQISALTTQCQQCDAEIHQLDREMRIGLRTDGGRRDEVYAQYEAAQAELQALDAAWHQQQTLVQEIIALRQALLTEAEGQQDEDDAANDDLLPQADTVPEETTAAAERLASLSTELDALHRTQLLVSPMWIRNRLPPLSLNGLAYRSTACRRMRCRLSPTCHSGWGRRLKVRIWQLSTCINTC